MGADSTSGLEDRKVRRQEQSFSLKVPQAPPPSADPQHFLGIAVRIGLPGLFEKELDTALEEL